MTNRSGEKQQGSPPAPRTIFEYASEGVTFDEMPETARKDVRRADKHKDERDALAEIRTDQLFAQAAAVMVELLDAPDGLSEKDPYGGYNVRLRAAAEVFRLRAVTLKANKKRQTAESVAKRIFDGFNFPSSGT